MSAMPRVRVRFGRRRDDSRSDTPKPMSSWMILSLVAHMAALVAFTTISFGNGGSTKPPPDPGFFVSLAALPPGGGPEPVRAETKPPPKKTEKKPPKPPEKKEVVLPKKPKPPEKVIEKPVPKRPEPDPSPQPPDTTETTDTPDEGTGEVLDPNAPPGIGVPGGEGDISALDQPGFEHAWYTGRVAARLKAVWRRPALPDGRGRSVVVTFSIRRDGGVMDVAVEAESDYRSLDLSAIRAVYDAAPMPPLPNSIRDAMLPTRVRFDLSPDR